MSDVSIIQMKEEKWLKNFNWNKKNWPFFFFFRFPFLSFLLFVRFFLLFFGVVIWKNDYNRFSFVSTGRGRYVSVWVCYTRWRKAFKPFYPGIGKFWGREDSTWKKKRSIRDFFCFLEWPDRTHVRDPTVRSDSLSPLATNDKMKSNNNQQLRNNLKATSFWIFH